MRITSKQREEVRLKFGGFCAYCGDSLQKGFHCDHMLPIKRVSAWDKQQLKFIQTGECEHPDRNTIENLVPSCPSCNILKGSNSLQGFRRTIEGFIISLNRDSTQYKVAKRYGLVKETDAVKVKFFFETYDKHKI